MGFLEASRWRRSSAWAGPRCCPAPTAWPWPGWTAAAGRGPPRWTPTSSAPSEWRITWGSWSQYPAFIYFIYLASCQWVDFIVLLIDVFNERGMYFYGPSPQVVDAAALHRWSENGPVRQGGNAFIYYILYFICWLESTTECACGFTHLKSLHMFHILSHRRLVVI